MENNQSFFEKNVQLGLSKKILSLNEDCSRITYNCCREYSTSYKNPEEKVRASYFVDLVLKYQYPQHRIDFEFTVPKRTPEDRADIVVFEDDMKLKPYLVVECKKDGISDSEFKQAIEQAFGNASGLEAKFLIVVAGLTKRAYERDKERPLERERNIITDIPVKYGEVPKYKYIKGEKDKELQIIDKEELIRALEKAHQTIWQGGKLAPADAFDEVSKLLFCKLKDEKETSITRRFEPYKFQIGTHETPKEVFTRINDIYQKAKQKDAEVFRDDIRLEPEIVFSVTEHIESINFNDTELDTKGVAFERFLSTYLKGDMGQYFTPREIIDFAVKFIEPQTDEMILDPACGSGGFLLWAMDYIRNFAYKEYPDNTTKAFSCWHDFAKDNLFGIEINDKIARVCKMNMIIHDDGHTNVISTDSLQDIDKIYSIHKSFSKEKFDIIVTNPPFGATVKDTEKDYIKNYKLGDKRKNQKTEILFIERCFDFLRDDGRMAIVLPDGILTNSSLQYVRDFIMENTEILAVVSLPQIAFAHFGAGVKSSLLFLRKKAKNETLGNYRIFMAIAERIGYDATGRKDNQNDFIQILEEYKRFKEEPINFQ
ncbi:MAG: methylase [Ignavibacteria bacterium]|nr:methylase [Ignavibacteria bacterium]